MRDDLIRAAIGAMQSAHAPYSGYSVGAAVQTTDGKIFTGCNIENASYGLTICAERVAIFSAVAAGHDTFREIAVAASGPPPPYPCGACRQVLAEFCELNLPVHTVCAESPANVETSTLGELLPKTFKLRD